MGGSGSGRWGWSKSDAKTLVEDCRRLDIAPLVRERVIGPNQYTRGGWQWTRNGQKVASVGYEADTRADAGTLRLTYTVGRDGEGKAALDYVVPLVTSRLVSGGRRWWFLCPGCRGGGPPCRRRVALLYLPPGGRVFACRRCHDLAYTSSRESRKWDGMFKTLAAATGYPVDVVKQALTRDRRGRRSGG